MDRRHFLTLMTLPAVAALLDACSKDLATTPSSATTGPTDHGAIARSQLARAATTSADSEPAAPAVNAFGADLYRAVAAADATGNLALSPTSVLLALAMTSAGARGTTLAEMLATLHADERTIHHAVNALSAQLDARNSDEVAVSVANSLWAQEDLAFEPAFLDLLAAEYGAGVHLVDYKADPEAARTAINDWVDAETRGRIPELIPKDVITTDSRLNLVNAIYLKAKWADEFDPQSTHPIDFTTAAGQSIETPAMSRHAVMPYAAGDGWQAVELPYKGDQLAMLVVVPDAGRLAAVESTLDVSTVPAGLGSREVELTLPKFDIDSRFSLAETLEPLGIHLAFSGDADFGAMTTSERLHIASVIHQANITVDEEGTEAAAATDVNMGAGAAAPSEDMVELVIDRPFLFAVRDVPTGAVLFVGRVADPSATRS
jgi:serpin B